MKNFQNKTIWITGASDGIGKELAVQFAQKGATIILTARNIEKLQEVKESLAGDQHLVYPLDLLETDQLEGAVQEVLGRVSTVDMIINNAGISQRSLVKDTDLAVDRRIMELNYFAIIILTKALLPHFQERKSGYVVAISSVAGKLGTPMRSAYCASKHAVQGFMDSLRAEVFSDNIQVSTVTPGSIQTNISKNALEGDGSKHGVTDPAIANGIPVEVCARKIIRGIQRQQPEILIAKGLEWFAAKLKRFFPNILFRLVRQVKTT